MTDDSLQQFENAFQSLQLMAEKPENIDAFEHLYRILLISIKQNLLESTTLHDLALYQAKGELLKKVLITQTGFLRKLKDQAAIDEFGNTDVDNKRGGNA